MCELELTGTPLPPLPSLVHLGSVVFILSMHTSSDLADCLQLQREEVETLEAIYGPEVVSYTFGDSPSTSVGARSDSLPTATLKIIMNIDLAEGAGGQARAVRLARRPAKSQDEAEASRQAEVEVADTFSLSHLPPLTFDIAYPPSYPMHSSPTLLSITPPIGLRYLDSSNLTSTLPDLLASTYADSAPDASLWTFLELVRTGEFLAPSLAGEVVQVPTDEITDDGLRRLRRKLEDWDRGMKGEGFERTTFDCGICLEEKKGRKCLELEGCGHILSVRSGAVCLLPDHKPLMPALLRLDSCRPCLTSCWTIAIEEGDVKSVACPSVDCVKKRATASAPAPVVEIVVSDATVTSAADDPPVVTVDFGSVVRDLLGDELYDRWVRLAEKKRIESG
jgi:hypothetical protein